MVFKIQDKELKGYNVSMAFLLNDFDYVVQTDEFDDFKDGYIEKEEGETEKEYLNSIYDDFSNSCMLYTLEEDFHFSMQEQHVLQSDKIELIDAQLVSAICSGVVIVHHPELDVYAIALTAAGSDISRSIEMAYRLVDGVSPFTSSCNIGLGDYGNRVLDFFREKVNQTNISDYKTLGNIAKGLELYESEKKEK